MMLEILTDCKDIRKMFLKKPVEIVERESYGRTAVEFLDNGTFFYVKDGERIRHGFSSADTVEGKHIGTDSARLCHRETFESEDELGKGKKIISVYQEDDLELRQELTLYECGDLTVQIFLNGNGDKVQTRYMVPFFAPYPDASGKEIFLS